MANILEVKVVGDISSLKKSLKEAQDLQDQYTAAVEKTSKELADLQKQKTDKIKLGLDVSDLNKQISDTQDNLVKLRGDLTKAGFAAKKAADDLASIENPISETGKASEKTADALDTMVNPLLEAGGASKEVTDGVNVLASALSGGLAGAISSVTGYLVTLYLNAQKAALAIHEVNNEAVKNAGEEIANIKALVEIAKNDVNTRRERLDAVQKLQDEYPAYFGNLSQEQILNGDVEKTLNAVTFALIQKAKAQVLASKIAENDLKILQLQQEGQQLFANFTAGKGAFAVLKGAAAQQFLKASADSTAASIDKLTKEQQTYTKELENSLKVANSFEAANDRASQKPKAAKKLSALEAVNLIEPVPSTDDQNDKILAMLRDSLSKDLNDLKSKGVEVKIPIQFVTPIESFSAYARALKQAQEETKIFTDGAGSAINALANDFVSSLSTGNAALDAFVGSVIQGLAQVAAAQLTGLIAKQAVATASLATDAAVSTGNAVVAATETASSTGPAAAFVLPALVGAAIGFIAAAFAGIKFAHGGIVPGGSFTGDKIPAMLNSGETVMNRQQQANTLMAIANGNSNSLQSNRVSSTFTLETKLRGADLLLSVKREERKR